ncbi:DUF1540 domain-containing protein [Paenibacillus sp. PK4536]|uniref:DUF1540 domain-containing protein n=1 Tax=Paenibacillus sp. PK4536 TaxID=3024576 RepID=UPI00235966C0|nr:DUF1540 domain-containing protein [Paenibacillus sp. PK4536]WIM41172.1 DUF1540 domain-containing protein [Paenibacillus sp. PK4536]
MVQNVLCEVNSCTHWAQENKCTAESIFIINHAHQKATESQETDCQTFDKKDSVN